MVQDQITREIVIAAPVERVWAVLTEPEHVGVWFGDAGAEVDLRPGGAMVFRWKEYGEHYAVLDEVEAPHRLVYRWARPTGEQPRPGNSTRVEFTLAADAAGTLLRVVESGFASLDGGAHEQATALADNTQGWAAELDELREYAQGLT